MNSAKKMFTMFVMVNAVFAISVFGAVEYDYTVPYTTDANTIALYHLNDGSGLTSVDSSGNGNTLSFASAGNATWLSSAEAKFPASALKSYGSAISAVDSASFDSLGRYLTAEAWLYIPNDVTMTTSQYRGLLTKTDWGVSSGFLLCLRGTGAAISESVAFRFQIGGGVLAPTVSTGLPIGEWFHIAAVLDNDGTNSIMRIFINSDLVGEYVGAQRSVVANNIDFRVNEMTGATKQFFDIAYDEVRISDVALTPIPEPATMLILLTGAAGLLARKLRRKV